MKRYMYMLLAFLLIILTLEMSNYETYYDKFINDVSKNIKFEEIGYKITYETSNSLKVEYNRIYELLSDKYKIDSVYKDDNHIEIKEKEVNLIVTLWKEDNRVHVDCVLIKNYKNMENYKNENQLEFLVNNNCENTRYFINLKGKLEVDINEDVISDLSEKCKDFKGISIDNGYVCTGKLNDETKLSVAYMKYNTGDYIIIGTPRIFVTY